MTNTRMAAPMTAGATNGTVILKVAWSADAPAMRAAFSRSPEAMFNADLMRRNANGE
jgi:hypothetical protein